MPSHHLILCHSLLLPPSTFPSIRVFSNESVLRIRWPKYWSFSFSISPSKEIQDWFPLGLNVWSPCSPRDSQESSLMPQFRAINSLMLSLLYGPTVTSIPDYWKNLTFNYTDLLANKCLCFYICCNRFVIAFLPRGKHLLIPRLQSPSAAILEPPKIKSLTVSIVSPSICHDVMAQDTMNSVFWMLSFKPAFSLSSFTFIKRLFSSSLLSAIKVV